MENVNNTIINKKENNEPTYYLDYTETVSYNYYLYKKRLELKLSRRKFAKLLKISKFRYKLIENGYLKPNKKEIIKISEKFEIDFNQYLEGINSYPTELDNKKFMKLTNFLYHLFKKTWLRMIFLSIALISLLSLIICGISFSKNDETKINNYNEDVQEFYYSFLENAKQSFSLLTFKYPQITNLETFEDYQKATYIKNSSYEKDLISLHFNQIYWYDNYRVYISLNDRVSDYFIWDVEFYDYVNDKTTATTILETEEFSVNSDLECADELVKLLKNNNIHNDFTNLIKKSLDLDITFDELTSSLYASKGEITTKSINLTFACFILLALTLLFGFIFGYSSIYKKDKNERYDFSHSDELLGFTPSYKTIKKDFKMFPFIPETFLRIFGILLVLFGSARAIVYTFNIQSYSVETMNSAQAFTSIQLLGMFIIFFINFDIYMDDYRLFRNLMLYPIAFFLIYCAEALILESVMTNESILSMTLSRVMLPNPFFSALCYFMIMFFLFFTPKVFKTKKQLIIFRLCAAIPIILIIASFLLGYADTLFGLEFSSYWTRLLFRGDRFPLSILAITYLLSLFFLRLHYKKKYGEENANKMFMGNRFIFLKNTMAAGIITIIWIFEMIFSANDTMNKLGIGLNTRLIILAPLLLLYHPHKCARNTKVDVALITIYGVLLTIVYIIAAGFAFISLYV